MPSGRFGANSAWILWTAIAHNLHAVARGATQWRNIVNVAARLARRKRRPVLHLPSHWPWSHHWLALWPNTIGFSPPTKAITSSSAARPETTPQEKLGRPADTCCPIPAASGISAAAHLSGVNTRIVAKRRVGWLCQEQPSCARLVGDGGRQDFLGGRSSRRDPVTP